MFTFKQFSVDDSSCAMKVGTDGVVLGAWASCQGSPTAIDVGAGSGLISLMLAQRGAPRVVALEIDKNACSAAEVNVANSPWPNRVSVHSCNFMCFTPEAKVDLIVSNPPFFANGEVSPVEQRALARHESSLNYKSLIDFSVKYLKPNGRLAFVYPHGSEDDVIYYAEMSKLKLRRHTFLRQSAKRPIIRSLYEFSPTDGPIEMSTLTIKEDNGTNYTTEFSKLCSVFYLEL